MQTQKSKVVVLGDSRAGKTSLLRRLISGSFVAGYASSIGIDWFSKSVYVDAAPRERAPGGAGELESESHLEVPEMREVSLILWDTGGQERFKSLTSSYTKDAAVAVLVYDVADRDSLASVSDWAEMARQGNPAIALFLAANKADLPRSVSSLEGERLAGELRCAGYFECSCKTGQGVEELFQAVAVSVLAAGAEREAEGARKDTIDVGAGYLGPERQRSGCWC